jgi:hypothetical protein
MRVILGAASVKAYVVAPKSLHVIGIVRLGQEYGLLATDIHGDFFRVNGSQVVGLNAQVVMQAVAAAREYANRNGGNFAPEQTSPCVVPVTFRKQRHYAVATHA